MLEARGSWLVSARKKAARAAPKPKVRTPQWRDLTKAQLNRIILLIPGYDPHRDSEGCWFDYAAANRALKFFATKLRHIEGALAGKPFVLEPWQQAVNANIFGWHTKDAKGRIVRRYREIFIYVARKNGKTPWMAGIALYVLMEDAEDGQQDYLAADSREQAGKLFRHAKGMALSSDELRERCRVYGGTAQAGQSKSIVKLPEETSFLQVISADAGSQHGGNSHLAIVDELHAQPNRDLVDVLQTSMASENRAQPLMIYITTADFARESICNEKLEYAKKVRDGIIPDAAFLPVVYETATDAEWTSEKTWAAANPNLGISVSLDYLRRECERAKETPTYENTFKRLHLNMRTEQDVRWLRMDKWDAGCTGDAMEWRAAMMSELAGLECVGGLDLSTTNDVTALALLFRRDHERIVLPFFWIPAVNAEKRERRDRVPYVTWARLGFVTMTTGDVVDYDVVRAEIVALGQQFNIRQIARDRWNASQITSQLMGDGFDVVDFGQGFASMSAPSKEFEKLLIGGELIHGGNPVLRWMASNCAAETDAAGNIKPSKKKSTERIDGIVATVMAIGIDMGLEAAQESYYETHDLELG